MVLLDEAVDELDLVRDALEEEERVDGVGIRVEEGGEEVRLSEGQESAMRVTLDTGIRGANAP